ncbi:MAG: hypothetical protein GXN93_04270 [Candidatus Diapherotrites archaeon]|nr:hypothetical protein [Candidatus Diapherotrites archaeon]
MGTEGSEDVRRGPCPVCKVRNSDPSEKTLHRCPYCGEYFCEKHVIPKLVMTFDEYQKLTKDPRIGDIIEQEWRKEGHPCPQYTAKFWEDLRKRDEEYARALEKFLENGSRSPAAPVSADHRNRRVIYIPIRQTQPTSSGPVLSEVHCEDGKDKTSNLLKSAIIVAFVVAIIGGMLGAIIAGGGLGSILKATTANETIAGNYADENAGNIYAPDTIATDVPNFVQVFARSVESNTLLTSLREYYYTKIRPKNVTWRDLRGEKWDAYYVLRWLADNTRYDTYRAEEADYGEINTYTPEEFLSKRSGICGDYAVFTATMMRALGYDNAYVAYVDLKGDTDHAVAIIKLRGKYYVLDQNPPMIPISGYCKGGTYLFGEPILEINIYSPDGLVDSVNCAEISRTEDVNYALLDRWFAFFLNRQFITYSRTLADEANEMLACYLKTDDWNACDLRASSSMSKLAWEGMLAPEFEYDPYTADVIVFDYLHSINYPGYKYYGVAYARGTADVQINGKMREVPGILAVTIFGR